MRCPLSNKPPRALKAWENFNGLATSYKLDVVLRVVGFGTNETLKNSETHFLQDEVLHDEEDDGAEDVTGSDDMFEEVMSRNPFQIRPLPPNF